MDTFERAYSRRQAIRAGAAASLLLTVPWLAAACSPAVTASGSAAGSTALGASGTKPTTLKTGFSWYLTHPVTKGWSEGIESLLNSQSGITIEYKVLDPDAKADVQVQQINTMIAEKYDVIWIQPIDSAAVAAPVKAARDAGIVVVTINIEANATHAAHVTQPHTLFSEEVGRRMAEALGNTGNVYLVSNAQGTSIYNLRKDGFLKGLGSGVKVLGEVDGQGDRKRAHDAFVPVLAGNPQIDGVWCINDDMALGVAQALREANRTAVVWGNGDGEADAIAAIKEGSIAGTVFTDIILQGQVAATAGISYPLAGIKGNAIPVEAEIDVPYVIVTKENADTVSPRF